jgi:hypothetical protein
MGLRNLTSLAQINLTSGAWLLLAGCTVTRPTQENYVYSAEHVPVADFVSAISRHLRVTATSSDANYAEAHPDKAYMIEANHFAVFLTAIPHDRCNPVSRRKITWDPAYRVDVVYLTPSTDDRAKSRQLVFKAASDVGQKLVAFTECPK